MLSGEVGIPIGKKPRKNRQKKETVRLAGHDRLIQPPALLRGDGKQPCQKVNLHNSALGKDLSEKDPREATEATESLRAS